MQLATNSRAWQGVLGIGMCLLVPFTEGEKNQKHLKRGCWAPARLRIQSQWSTHHRVCCNCGSHCRRPTIIRTRIPSRPACGHNKKRRRKLFVSNLECVLTCSLLDWISIQLSLTVA